MSQNQYTTPAIKIYILIQFNSMLNIFFVSNSIERFKVVEKILLKYEKNDMTRFWLGPVLFIFVNEPDLIKQVLSSPDCIEKSFTYKFLRLDKGLLAAKREYFFLIHEKLF